MSCYRRAPDYNRHEIEAAEMATRAVSIDLRAHSTMAWRAFAANGSVSVRKSWKLHLAVVVVAQESPRAKLGPGRLFNGMKNYINLTSSRRWRCFGHRSIQAHAAKLARGASVRWACGGWRYSLLK